MNTYTGTIVSKKDEKSAVAEIKSFAIHPKYKKRMARTSRFLLHDEIGVKEGDVVKFVEVRPISKLKCWKVTEVVKVI